MGKRYGTNTYYNDKNSVIALKFLVNGKFKVTIPCRENELTRNVIDRLKCKCGISESYTSELIIHGYRLKRLDLSLSIIENNISNKSEIVYIYNHILP